MSTQRKATDYPTVLLIHGLGGSHRSWQLLTPQLDSKSPVVALDLPACDSIEGQAEGVGRDIGSVSILVGHSRGALVATAIAEHFPNKVSRLVLLCPPWSTASRLSAANRHERALAIPVLGQILWALATPHRQRVALRSAFASSTPVPEAFRTDLRVGGRRRFVTDSQAIDHYLSNAPLTARLARLFVPTDLVLATRDARVADPGSAFADLPHVNVSRLNDVGHTPQWEVPDVVAGIIGRAWREEAENR
jgi:pimeloyl-ACP methyl ester carboxylesterase